MVSFIRIILTTAGVHSLYHRCPCASLTMNGASGFNMLFCQSATIEPYNQSLYTKGSFLAGNISACPTRNLSCQVAKGENKILRQEWWPKRFKSCRQLRIGPQPECKTAVSWSYWGPNNETDKTKRPKIWDIQTSINQRSTGIIGGRHGCFDAYKIWNKAGAYKAKLVPEPGPSATKIGNKAWSG